MNKRMLTGVYVNPAEQIAEVRTIEETLENFYSLLGCDLIDITERTVRSKKSSVDVSIVCDDEGLLKENPIVSAFDSNNEPVLVGNLFIIGLGNDDEGNCISLSKKGTRLVLDQVRTYFKKKEGKVYSAVVGVDFIS